MLTGVSILAAGTARLLRMMKNITATLTPRHAAKLGRSTPGGALSLSARRGNHSSRTQNGSSSVPAKTLSAMTLLTHTWHLSGTATVTLRKDAPGRTTGPTHQQLTLYTRPSTARSLATTIFLKQGRHDDIRARLRAWRRVQVRNMTGPDFRSVGRLLLRVKTPNNPRETFSLAHQCKGVLRRIVDAMATTEPRNRLCERCNLRQICFVSGSETLRSEQKF